MGNNLKSRLHMSKKDKGDRPSRNDNSHNQAKIDEAIMSGPNRARVEEPKPTTTARAQVATNARDGGASPARDAAASGGPSRSAVASGGTARDAEAAATNPRART